MPPSVLVQEVEAKLPGRGGGLWSPKAKWLLVWERSHWLRLRLGSVHLQVRAGSQAERH